MNEQMIPISLIDPNPYQKRKEPKAEDVAVIALSIATDGLLQPPKVREVNGRYQLGFGHTRTDAFKVCADIQNKHTNGYAPELIEAVKQALADGKDFTKMPVFVEDLSSEQMARYATIENSQREDLSDIERMEEMKTWVTEFQYSSKQIAALYPGLSDSTVRGILAFDKLIPEAKARLHEGKYSQGVGRALLAAQKVATLAQMKDIVKELDENIGKISSSDRWNDPVVPEIVIQEAIEELPQVLELWWSGKGDKPRACAHDNWLLDMKNFPNKYLPPLAVEGLSADAIDHLSNPPACTACPFYIKMRGTHYCGIKDCFERKETAWKRELMHRASKSIGITVYDPDADGECVVLQNTWQNPKHSNLFKNRNKDLRLAQMVDIDRKKGQSGYANVPKGCVVVVVGKTLKSLLDEKKEVAQVKAEAKAEGIDLVALHEELFDEKFELFRWEAALYFKPLFDAWPPAALNALEEASYGWSDNGDFLDDLLPANNASPATQAEFDRRRYAYFLLSTIAEIFKGKESLVVRAEALRTAAKDWKVKLPARLFKLAEEMDTEIKDAITAAKPVAVETPSKKGKKG